MGRKPLLAIAGAFVAGVTLCGCETGRPYYDGPRSYLPSQGFRAGSYVQGGTMYSPPQFTAGAPSPATPMAMTLKAAPVEATPTIQPVSGSVPAGTTPMLTITMPAVRFQVPLTGAITYAQTGTTAMAGPASVEQLPASATLAESPLMQAPPPHAPVPAQYAPTSVPLTTPTVPGPLTTPTVQSTNYAAPPQTSFATPPYTAPATPVFATPSQSTAMVAPPMPAPAQYLPPVCPAPRNDAAQLSADVPPPPVWPKTPGEGAEEMTAPPVPPPIHRGPAMGTTPARPTLYYQ